ncbi:MAG: hypothetical protein ACM3JI_01890 [Anaerolineae bacterium]
MSFFVGQHLHAFRLDDPIPIEESSVIKRLPNETFIYFLKDPSFFVGESVIRLRRLEDFPIGYENGFVQDLPFLGDQETHDFFLSFCQQAGFLPSPRAIAIAGNIQGNDLKKFFSHDELIPGLFRENDQPLRFTTCENNGQASLHFSYRMPLPLIQKIEDLRQQWIKVLFQMMFQNRLEECLERLELSQYQTMIWTAYPMHSFGIWLKCPANDFLEVFAAFLLEIESIKKKGLTEKDFEVAKNEAFLELENFARSEYPFAECVNHLLGDRGFVSCDFFLAASQPLLSSICLDEVSSMTQAFLDENRRSIDIFYPTSAGLVLTQEKIEEMLEAIPFSETSREAIPLLYEPTLQPLLTAMSFDPEFIEDETNIFFQLPLDEVEKRIISKLIRTMAEKNIIKLAFEKRSLEKKGKRINHVHPLRFLAFIFGDPQLKSCMHQIRKSSFKWDHFVDGLAKRLKEESENNTLLPYLPGFCNYLNLNIADVASIVHNHHWESLVRYLLSH